MKWFKNYVGRFAYLWRHVTAFDCRMVLIGDFLFSPEILERRYEEEFNFQKNLEQAFKR